MAAYLAATMVLLWVASRVYSTAASMVESTAAYSVELLAVPRVEWWAAWMAASMEILSAAWTAG